MRGKCVLITGASGGLGREIALKFAINAINNVSTLILSGRDLDTLKETRDVCKRAGKGHIVIVSGNLQRKSTIDRLVNCASKHDVHYLVCCAGEYLRGDVANYDIKEILSVLHSNTTATIHLITRMLPLLVKTHGTIIHINSMAGKNIAPDEAIYSASKHAMTGFLKSLRFEARRKHIRVLDVFPGVINTPLAAGRALDMMSPDEVAIVVVFFAMIAEAAKTLQVEELHLGRFRKRALLDKGTYLP